MGSLRNPLVIILTLPLALVGVMVALAVTDRALGLAAMMGVLLLIGIVVTNAIVLISFVEQQRARGLTVYDALISGARVRLRPILMTALTTSFALLPLAVETGGNGGLISAELATVVIGGLTSLHGIDAAGIANRLHALQRQHSKVVEPAAAPQCPCAC